MSQTTQQVKFSNRYNDFVIGGLDIHVIAGPCSLESEEHFLSTAAKVKNSGASMYRGGIYKMRTSPQSFQGLGESAFDFLMKHKAETQLPIVSEITDPRQISKLIEVVDILQVGSRNMYNYELLKELSKTSKPILFKRAFSATLDEWLKAADYLQINGHHNVILCERGIRTFETKTRNTLDLNAVAYLKKYSSYPVIVDPSHGTGRADLVPQLSKAAIAMGADGLLIEAHENPQTALSDGDQALPMENLKQLIQELDQIAKAVGRKLA